jgi:hypothetical protein
MADGDMLKPATLSWLLLCILAGGACRSVQLNGTAVPNEIRAAPGERVPIQIEIRQENQAYWVQWEVRSAKLGYACYVASDPQDLKYQPELPVDPNCGSGRPGACGRSAVFIPVREGQGEIRITAVAKPGFFQATASAQLIASIPVTVVKKQGQDAPAPDHVLVYRRAESWFSKAGDVEKRIEGTFSLVSASPGGRWLATSSPAGTDESKVRILERESGKETGAYTAAGDVREFAWKSGGSELAIISNETLLLMDPLQPAAARRAWLPSDSKPYGIVWAGLSGRLDFHTMSAVWHAFESHLAEAKQQSVESFLGPGELLSSADRFASNPRDEESLAFTRPVPTGQKPDVRHALFIRYDRRIWQIGESTASYRNPHWAPDGPWLYVEKLDSKSAGGVRLMRMTLPDGPWLEIVEGADRVSVAAPCSIR